MTRSIGSVVPVAVGALTTIVALPVVYLATVTLAAALPRHARRAIRGEPTRFAVVVPAHDEALVIGETLAALRAVDYPSAMFSIHVVADNCTDDTVRVVADQGFDVHERADTASPGKGPALNWLFDRLDGTADLDVVVVIDADSIVEQSFLRALDAEFRSGVDVAQGQYFAREPELSTAVGFRFAALACRHHLRPLGRSRLGGSAGLYGNGMAFRAEVLRRHRWSGHLVEDAEMQIELLLRDGIRVQYAPEARLVAEMPATAAAAASQNERWERGRLQLMRATLPRLVRALATKRHRRVAVADAIADQLIPPLSVLAAANVATIAVGGAVAVVQPDARRWLLVSVASLTALVAHVFAGLVMAGAPRAAYASLLDAPRQVMWKTSLWLNSLRPGRSIEWQRTRRNAET